MKRNQGHGDPPPASMEFSERLEHGDMVMLTSRGNKELRHRVPREAEWQGERYSIVFRVVKEEK